MRELIGRLLAETPRGAGGGLRVARGLSTASGGALRASPSFAQDDMGVGSVEGKESKAAGGGAGSTYSFFLYSRA